jgi:hypothetical protein
VKNSPGPALLEQASKRLEIAHIELNQLAVRGDLFQCHRGPVVAADHAFATTPEGLEEVRPDHSGEAGD